MLMELYHAMHDDIYSNISNIKLEKVLCTLMAYINISIVMPDILYMCGSIMMICSSLKVLYVLKTKPGWHYILAIS